MKEYAQYDGLGLAELVRRKEVSPKELLEAAILHTESVNPSLNAVVTPLYDYAHDYISKHTLTGPFAYVPFLLKDVHHALQGTPMSNGSNLHKGEVSEQSAEIVQRYLKAGSVVFGKTNTPEYKMGPTTTNPVAWGPTRNPWEVARSAGGSSGGSAAAVASGMAPMATGTDEGGSIRVPASCCGVFGLKPSRGRNPIGPDFRWEAEGVSASHVLTRSVRDSAAALDATCGPEPGGSTSAPAPSDFLASLSQFTGKLRVGISTATEVCGRPIDAHCIDAVGETAKLLTDLGHHVEEVELPYDEAEVERGLLVASAVHLAGVFASLREKYGAGQVQRQTEAFLRFTEKGGLATPVPVYLQVRFQMRQLAQTMARFHQQYDVLVTSTMSRLPPLLEEAEPLASDRWSYAVGATPFGSPLFAVPGSLEFGLRRQVESFARRIGWRTPLANLTGQPAMSVPLHFTENGLPVGVQFFGRYGDERTLLQLAAQLEEARPWRGRFPFHTSTR